MKSYRIEMDESSRDALLEQLKDVEAGYTPLGFAKDAILQARDLADVPCCSDKPDA